MKVADLLAQRARPTERAHPRNERPGAFSAEVHAAIAVGRPQLEAAQNLVRRRYAWRGYQSSTNEVENLPVPDRGHAEVTLVASQGARLLATLTVRPCAPLLAERTYADEMARLRDDGQHVGELVKLAMEAGADWRRALDALVQSAYMVTRFIHELTDVVIEVNPRHARFYARVFGFVEAGSGGVCGRVGAPSVLLRLDLEEFGRRLRPATQPG